ncbi:hypothetical protein Moror_3323 [Moniliophthora roreri MCA 2997]|uniref:F-box domain-containing protein n=1 Tax=Moniliophthora roreri (strain MCA 2997) TaxID=1381753 RepID=V2X2G5_MONRO|nr:hypothetical protein Moror_3323 [Moniliophthora roreri MCA 2997]
MCFEGTCVCSLDNESHRSGDAVLGSLASLPRLARFEVDADQQSPLPPLPFHKLGNGTLRRLSLSGCFSDPPPLSALSALLQCNSDIIELKLDNRHFRGSPHHFHQMFEQVAAGTLHLQSLYLRGWVIKPTPKMIPHTRSLHTLCLLDNNVQYQGELWKLLQSSGTSLRRLTVNYIKSDFLAYLESFTGLEELSIPYPDRKEEDTTEVPRRFYTETLQCHSESLRRLEVLPRCEGSWTIGLNDVNVFDCCTKLITLTVGLKSDDVQPQYSDIDVVVSV